MAIPYFETVDGEGVGIKKKDGHYYARPLDCHGSAGAFYCCWPAVVVLRTSLCGSAKAMYSPL
jgi:hypothetical protein